MGRQDIHMFLDTLQQLHTFIDTLHPLQDTFTFILQPQQDMCMSILQPHIMEEAQSLFQEEDLQLEHLLAWQYFAAFFV